MEDIFVYYADLGSVKATCAHNEDGSYSIFLNSRLCWEQQATEYMHELQHILSDDFNRRHEDIDVSRLEYYAHRLIG